MACRRPIASARIVAILLPVLAVSARAGMPPFAWQPMPIGGTNGFVLTAAEFDDGTGPALYVGGTFTSAGGVSASRIARWNGMHWSALGTGLNGQVSSLAVYAPEGGTARLYAGGSFPGCIAQWNGRQWLPVGSPGLSGGPLTVNAMTVLDDDGPGPNPPCLIVAGTITAADGQPALNVARWNGTRWYAAPGSSKSIQSLQVVPGAGAAQATLFAATSTGLLRMTGTSWNDYAWANTGLTTGLVRSLCAYAPTGSPPTAQPLLICGGDFLRNPAPADRLAAWEGAGFSAIGSGLGTDALIYALTEFGQTHPLLILGGAFNTVDGLNLPRIACWNGHSWSAIRGIAGGHVRALATVHLQGEPLLVVGGSFSIAAGGVADYIRLFRRVVHSQPLGDVDGDGTIDGVDVGLLADSWRTVFDQAGYDARCDLDCNGQVDIRDLLALAANWAQ